MARRLCVGVAFASQTCSESTRRADPHRGSQGMPSRTRSSTRTDGCSTALPLASVRQTASRVEKRRARRAELTSTFPNPRRPSPPPPRPSLVLRRLPLSLPANHRRPAGLRVVASPAPDSPHLRPRVPRHPRLLLGLAQGQPARLGHRSRRWHRHRRVHRPHRHAHGRRKAGGRFPRCRRDLRGQRCVCKPSITPLALFAD